MEIRVNDEKVTFTQESVNVLELLEFQEVDMPDMVSVSINGDVLKRETFETTLIKEGDAVEFVYFMGGGCPGRSPLSAVFG
ncbi:MAG: sulfur carrier protein ThiS [Planctomycetes bacterium]|nr:sulfur carrier protein ThiS [Planctomycetota bacterium]